MKKFHYLILIFLTSSNCCGMQKEECCIPDFSTQVKQETRFVQTRNIYNDHETKIDKSADHLSEVKLRKKPQGRGFSPQTTESRSEEKPKIFKPIPQIFYDYSSEDRALYIREKFLTPRTAQECEIACSTPELQMIPTLYVRSKVEDFYPALPQILSQFKDVCDPYGFPPSTDESIRIPEAHLDPENYLDDDHNFFNIHDKIHAKFTNRISKTLLRSSFSESYLPKIFSFDHVLQKCNAEKDKIHQRRRTMGEELSKD